MVTLREILDRARVEDWAVPHFNVADSTALKGIVAAARERRSPLLVGTSEGEAEFFGRRQAIALVHSYRDEYSLPVFLNADHHHSIETAKAAIDAGYDSVHIDLSKLSLDDNIAGTKEVVAYARAKNPQISVEGEVGYLVTDGSKVYKEVIDVPPESLAKVEDAVRFVKETGVDRLAPAVGTRHGIAANAKNVDLDRIRAIHAAVGNVALVLHGGSGTADDQVRAAVAAGIANVHFSTEVRIAYEAALRTFIDTHPDEIAPYKFFAPAVSAAYEVALKKIDLFGSANRA